MSSPAARPSVATLCGLDTDAWSSVLAVALPVLKALPPAQVDVIARRVASLPIGKLVAGRSRRDLATVLVREPIWRAVVAAWPEGAPQPWTERDGATTSASVPDADAAIEVARLATQVDQLRARERDLTTKVAERGAALDEARRAAEGASARAEAAERARETAEADRDAARAEASAATAALSGADADRERALGRARRRDEAEDRAQREALTAARAEVTDLRRRLVAAEARAVAAEERLALLPPPARAPTVPTSGRGRRGRPSRLPDGVDPRTREAAEWLVGAGRDLLVDGYNVTRSHRSSLAFAEQRRWLENAVAALAARRGVRATIVWDASEGRPTTTRQRSGLTVRYSAPDTTADDELVQHVATLLEPDAPVVVVTDDVELRGRLAEYGVDVLDSQMFVWLL